MAANSSTPGNPMPSPPMSQAVKRPCSELSPTEVQVASTQTIKAMLHEVLSSYGIEASVDSIKVDIGEIKDSINHAHAVGETAKMIAEDNQNKIGKLENEVDMLKSSLKEEREERLKLECYERRPNLKFYGFDEESDPEKETGKICEQKLNAFLKSHLGFTQDAHIERCHRMGRRHKNYKKYKRPIIVRFSFYKERQMAWENKKLLIGKNTGIHLREDFPPVIEARVNRLFPIFKAAKKLPKAKVSLTVDRLFINGSKYTVDNLHTLPPALQPESLAMKYTPDVCLFWKADAFLSNFHPCKFTEGSITYTSVEQYFCATKARTFQDSDALAKIMSCDEPGTIKATPIQNFREEDWMKISVDVMRKALSLKFEQNDNLRLKLLETGERIIAEASPRDKFWGIGINMHRDEALDMSKWGTNKLGTLLMEIRSNLQ